MLLQQNLYFELHSYSNTFSGENMIGFQFCEMTLDYQFTVYQKNFFSRDLELHLTFLLSSISKRNGLPSRKDISTLSFNLIHTTVRV